MWGQWECGRPQAGRLFSLGIESDTLILDILDSRTVRNSHPVYGTLLYQPEKTKTHLVLPFTFGESQVPLLDLPSLLVSQSTVPSEEHPCTADPLSTLAGSCPFQAAHFHWENWNPGVMLGCWWRLIYSKAENSRMLCSRPSNIWGTIVLQREGIHSLLLVNGRGGLKCMWGGDFYQWAWAGAAYEVGGPPVAGGV